jgi:hypothetical protein
MAVTVARRQFGLSGRLVALSLAVLASAAAAVAIASYVLRQQGVEVARVERVAYPSTTPFREQILAVEGAGAVLPSTTPFREQILAVEGAGAVLPSTTPFRER